MSFSLERFLDQTATKGTWYGGGSAAALGCSLAAALLEKLARQPSVSSTVRAARRRVTPLIEEDARAFARAIHASRRGPAAARRALEKATDIPWEVLRCSHTLLKASDRIRPTISPRYRVDLHCAIHLATASGRAARALVLNNLRWLGDGAYTRTIRRKLHGLGA